MFKPMNVLDAGLLMMESPETPMHIAGVQILRRPRGAGEQYLRRVREAMLRHPADSAPFNYRLAPGAGAFGQPAWEVLDNVDLSEHLFHHALPWPGGERELYALVSRLNAGVLPRHKPLWEQHLIEGLGGNRFAIFTRIHHALMDGKWAMKVALETTSADPSARDVPPYWAVHLAPGEASREPPQLASWWERQSHWPRDAVETLGELRQAFGRLVESFRHPADDGLVPIYSAPECMLNGRLSAQREFAVVRLSLARIKAIAQAQEATVNEVVLALCGGALRRYLLARGRLPEKALIANMPMALARPGGEIAGGGNAVVSAFVSLASHLADPVQRLHAVRGSSRHAKELLRDLPSQVALSVYLGVTGLPFILAHAAGHAERVHPQNLVISNVPGARERRWVNGAEVLVEYPLSVLVPGQAMNITVVSHAQWLDAGVLVCPSLAPAPDEVAQGMADALDELQRALRPRRRAAPAAPEEPATRRRS